MIRAFRGEFGLKVRFHAPVVYGMGMGHTIEIEAGEEALYPLAAAWKVVPRDREDVPGGAQARGRHGRPRLGGPPVFFTPRPHVAPSVPPLDVVVTPRWRAYGASKNWPHWIALVQALERAGVRTFAGGVADASDVTVAPYCSAGVAWDYPRPLDATLEALHRARLVVTQCGGLAHLAVAVGTPMLLFTYEGKVAPGPVIDSSGRVVQKDYWPVRWDQYYVQANHTGTYLEQLDGWMHVGTIVARTLALLTSCTHTGHRPVTPEGKYGLVHCVQCNMAGVVLHPEGRIEWAR